MRANKRRDPTSAVARAAWRYKWHRNTLKLLPIDARTSFERIVVRQRYTHSKNRVQLCAAAPLDVEVRAVVVSHPTQQAAFDSAVTCGTV